MAQSAAPMRIAGIRRCSRAALLQATALRAAFVVVLATPAAAQLSPGARPTGGTVVGGQATIGQNGNTTLINQSSQRTAINWQTFNVGSQQTVDFVQPNSKAIALNTVIGANPSEIAGRIDANGQIIIVNQSGVVFDRGSQVDTEGLTVSAAGITNQNFMAGHMVFDQAPHPGAKITNAGTITVHQAGLAALVAPQVANSGIIQATLGRVILAGAATYTLDLYGDGLLALNVTSQVTNVLLNGQSVPALVTNTGTIVANGGTVMLTASAADGLIRTLVEAGGTIAANSVGSATGTILAQGVGGSVEIDGNVTATGVAAGNRGGQVVADATGNVTIAANAVVDVSGDAGGGLIAIGTTAARAAGGPHTPSSMTAGTTTIASGAVLRADATGNGQGGRVTLLSSRQTNFSGAISARGGAHGGRGGWVEISSLQGMTYNGSIDTSAPLGGYGNILIDPTNLEITNGPTMTGFTKITPMMVDNMKGAVDLSATDTLLLVDAVTANTMATSFELDAGISLILQSNLTAPGIPVTLMGGTTGLTLQAGTVTAGALTLMSQGIITETGGAFSATSLTGSAAGDVTLQSASNTLTTLGAFTSGGEFFLTDSEALTVSAAVKSTTGLALVAPSLTVAATGTVTGAPILLIANQFDLSGGVTATGMGLVAINLMTTGTLAVGGASSNFSAAGLGNIVAGTLALGTINGIAAAPQTTELDFDSTVAFSGNVSTLGLFATGLVTDAAGGITVADMYGAAGTATLTGANAINTLTSYSTSLGTLQFDNSAALTITGDVTGATGVVISAAGLNQTAGTLAATSGDITLNSTGALAIGGAVTASTIMLGAAAGDISESGAMTATSLSGSASGAVTLDGLANHVGTLTGLNASAGAATFADATSLSVTGPIGASAGVTILVTGATNTLGLGANLTGADVTLSAAGNISQTGGLVTATTTTIALASSGGGISLGGVLDATTTVSLMAGGGDIVETVAGISGAITATSLSGSASGAATLDGGANSLAAITGFDTTGDLTIDDAASLAISAPIKAGGAVDIAVTGTAENGAANTLGLAADITGSSVTLSAPGDITQASGLVTATTTGVDLTSTAGGIALGGTLMAATAISLMAGGGDIVETVGANTGTLFASSLSGSASGMVTLDSTANSITTLASLTASAGTLSFYDMPDLTVTGAVTATGDVTITSGGALSQSGGTIGSSGGDALVTAATSLAIGGTVSGTNVQLTANGGDITETVAGGSGSVAATTLDVSATGAVTLGSATNNFTAIGAVTIGTSLTLADTVPLDIMQAFSGTTLSFTAPALTIDAGGGLTAKDIILRADSFDLLAAVSGSTLVALGLYTAGGTLALGGVNNSITGLAEINAGTLALGSLDGATADPHVAELDIDTATDFTAIAPVVGLFATGLVTDAAGGITAGALYGAAGTATLNGANTIATLQSYATNAGTLQLADSTALAITGNVTGATGVLIGAAGIDQSAGTVAATTGDLTLNSTGALAIGGTLSAIAGLVSLAASAGDITESGAITATSLTGSASGAVTLNDPTNDVGAVTGFTATAGAVSFDDAASLSVTGPVSARTGVTIAVTGGANTLGLSADITGADVTLSAPGGVTQSSGLITADTSTIALASSGGGIALGGTLNATTSISLMAGGGDIVETVAGVSGAVTATSLSGSASGAVTLDSGTNAVGTVTGLTASSGAVTLVDATALDATGTIGATGAVALTVTGAGNALTLDADIGGTSVGFSVDGDITQSSGAISATSLSGSAAGAVTLNSATNDFGALTGFAANALSIEDASSLIVSGAVSVTNAASIEVLGGLNTIGVQAGITAGSVSLTAPGEITQTTGTIAATAGDIDANSTAAGIAFGGTLAASATVSLSAAAGDITETVAGATTGVVRAGTLTGMVTDGSLLLPNNENQIATLGGFPALTDFILADGIALTVTDAVSAGSTLMLQSPGITVAATGSLNGLPVILQADAFDLIGGVTSSGLVAIDRLTAGTLALGGANDSFGGAGVASISAGTLALGSLDGLAAAAQTSELDLNALTDFTSITPTLGLFSTGAILEPGGISVVQLYGTAGSAALTGSNMIATLNGYITTIGDFSLSDAASLNVGQAVTAAGKATIAVTGPGNTLTVPVDITGTSVSLSGDGGLTQTAGTVQATTGNVSLAASGGTVAFAGTLTAPGTVSLMAGLDIDETGTLIAATLTGSAGGSATLTGSNSVATLGDFQANVLTLLDTPDLAVTGTVGGGTSVAITDTGTLTIPGTLAALGTSLTAAAIGETGEIVTDTVTGSATGTASFSGSNQIAALGDFTAAGLALSDGIDLAVSGTVDGGASVTITDERALTVPGSIAGSTTSLTGASIGIGGSVTAPTALTLTATAGAIDESGVLTTALLTGSATGSAALIGANQVASLGDFAAAGFTLDDTPDLAVTGTVNGAASVAIDDSGALTIPGTLIGTLTTLTAASIGETGSIQAGTLTGSSAGTAAFAGANQIATLGDFTAAGFALLDTPSLAVTGTVDGGASVAIADAGALTVPGSITGATTSLTGASIGIGGSVTAATQLTLTATAGAIDESGSLATALLTGSATGSAALAGSNQVADLGDFTAAGFSLSDTPDLAVTGTVDGGTSVSLTDTGTLTIPGTLIGTATALTAASIGETGSIQAGTLSGSSTGTAAFSGTNQIATLGDFTAAGFSLLDTPSLAVTGTVDGGIAVSITDAGALTVPGSITGSTTSLTAASIGIGGSVTAPVQLTLTATAGAIDETGSLVTALLTGSATGSASLTGANQIAALGDFAAAGLTLNDTPDLAVTGTVDGGASVSITDAGALTVPGSITGAATALTGASLGIGGTIDAATSLALTATAGAIDETGGIATALLTGSATGSAALTGTNQIASLGDFDASGIVVSDTPNLAVTGTVDGGASVTITDTGALSVAGSVTGSTTALTGASIAIGGSVTAATQLTLTATAGTIGETGAIDTALLTGSATASAAFTGTNQIAALGDFTAGGLTLDDTTDLAVTGSVDGGTSVVIADQGALSVPGSIAGSTTALTGASLAIGGSVTAPTQLTLTATAGSIDEPGSLITALLTGNATGSTALTGSNQIADLGDFTAAGFALNDTPNLALTGAVAGGLSVTIADAGALSVPGSIAGSTTALTAASIAIGGTVTAPTKLSLTATDGAIGETGSIATALLTGSATLGASLTGNNQVTGLGDFTAAGFTLDDTPGLAVTGTVDGGAGVTIADAGALSVPGSITGSTTMLTASSIAIGGSVAAPTQLTLVATAGTIGETGAIDTALLTGSATASAAFTGTNQIAALGDFTAGGLTLDDTTDLAVTGSVDGGTSVVIADQGALSAPGSIAGSTTALTGASLAIGGTVTAPTLLTLTATAGAIDEPGSLTTALLTGSATGSAALTGSNQIAALGDFTAAGVALNDTPNLAVTGAVAGGLNVTITDAGALSVPGSIAGSTTSLTAASIAIGGTVAAPTKLSLTATAGTINEPGFITTALLTGSAIGSAALIGSNTIATLGDFTAAGFTLNDTPDLAVTGTVNGAASTTITDTGTLTIPGTLIGSTTSLTAAAIGETGTIQAITMTGSATGTAAFTGANQIAALGNFTAAGFSLTDTPDLVVSGTVNGGPSVAITDGGNLTIPGTIEATTTSLIAASIGETGTIAAATLTGSATGAAAFGGTNQVATLGDFTAAGFSLTDTPNLSVTGTVNGGASIVIADTGNLTIPGTLISSLTSLTAASIGESGTIQATTLTGSTTGTAAFTGLNQIANLSDFSAAGFSLNDTPNLSVTGIVRGGASIAIDATGTLSIPGTVIGSLTSLIAAAIGETGSIQATTLTGSTTGTAAFAGSNQIAALGDFNAAGFSLNDTQDLSVAGTVNGGASLVITDADNLAIPGTLIGATTSLTAASIDESGTIEATTLTGSTTGSAHFAGANQIADLGNFTAAGFSLVDMPNLAVTGSVNGGVSIAITDAGNLTIPGTLIGASTSLTAATIGETGSIQTAVLTGNATGTASFTGGNQIASLGNFSAAALVLDDTPDLAVTGIVDGGASIAIIDTGNLTIPGTLIADSTSLTAATIAEGGSIQATSLTGSTSGNASFTGSNSVATLDQFTSATGTLTFDDTADLSVAGALAAAAGVTLTVTGNALGIAADITGADIALTAAGSITQSSGLLLATDPLGLLTLDAADLVSLNGGLNGQTIVIGKYDAPRDVTLNDVTITTGSNVRAGTPKPPFPATGGSAKGFFVHTDSFRQTGTMNVNANGASATVDITITGNGMISFDPTLGLYGPSTELFLNVDRGTANGHVVLSGLNVSYTLPGSPNLSQLTGTVGGLNGQPAAGNAYIVPLPNANYRLNACAIQSVDCILLSPVIVPVGNPIENIQVDTPRRRRSDDDLVLPNVSEEDF